MLNIMKPDIKRLVDLHSLLLQFQAVIRASQVPGENRGENDVEHSYILAMGAWYLAPHFPELDSQKLIKIALAHDIVEIHAGDTPAFGPQEDIATKEAREKKALDRLAKEWADFPDMLEAILDYKNKASAEAKFVYALDKILPAILNYLSQGATWKRFNVTIEDFIVEKERKIPKDSPLWSYYEQLLALLKTHPEMFVPSKATA